jgi:hypothetical protein
MGINADASRLTDVQSIGIVTSDGADRGRIPNPER